MCCTTWNRLVPAVGVTPANAPEATVTDSIAADLAGSRRQLAELHIDRAYLAARWCATAAPDLAIYCKAWPVRSTGGRFAKTGFALDWEPAS